MPMLTVSRAVLGSCLVVLVFAMAPVARAHDSLGPPDAPHTGWPPDEDWVMEHWIPFDEARLQAALGLPGVQLEAYTLNDHHTFAELARRRGVDVDALADDLVAPWQGQVAPAELAVLRDRTVRVLTQGHLAQHVFFHVFHRFGLEPVAPRLFGVSAHHLNALRLQGMTPLEVSRRHGGASEAEMIRGLAALLRQHRDDAVAGRQEPAAEADRMLARQLARLPCWVRSLRPTADPGNPYGKAIRQHGPHPRAWPSTAQERRVDEARAERFRRHMRWTCWPRLPRWRWPAPPA